MFHYNTLYPTQSSLSPRDKYLAALAMAKEAGEEYLSAEAAVENEEFALRRRLEELELQKHRLRGTERYPSYGYYDHSAPLRRQLEEEQRLKVLEEQTLARRALALKIEQEKHERRQREYYKLISGGHTAALEAEAARHRAQLANVASIRSRPDYPSIGPDSIFPEESKRPLSFGGYANVVATLAAKEKAVRHCPYVGKIQVKCDDAKKPLSSALSGKAETVLLSRANDTDEAPVRNGIVELLKAILGDAAEVKTSPVASPSPAPSTSKSSEIVPESKRSEVEPRQLSHTTVEECLGAMLGHFAQKVEAPASRADAATSGSKPVEKKASAIESSLKAKLEARLNNDQSNEIKDTIQAIFVPLLVSVFLPTAGHPPPFLPTHLRISLLPNLPH